MNAADWNSLIEECADPVRARRYFDALRETAAGPALDRLDADAARVAIKLFSGSRSLSEQLLTYPEWLNDLSDVEDLKRPRRHQTLAREVALFINPALESGHYSDAFQQLRLFKGRQLLRIAARDLGGLADVTALTLELSNLADLCLESVYQLCWHSLSTRWGAPYHTDPSGKWRPTAFAVLGMGKLGGQELNYSSDADLLFVYSDEGNAFKEPPKGKKAATGKNLANYQWFKLLCEMMINELTRLTADGALYRIDMRLRPEGKNGPLARSLASYETYYAQAGQTWERMMLIKTRAVAGDPALGAEFVEMIQPFRYPRSLSDQTSHEVAATKQRIESEVIKAGEMDRNVKLGPGGIRDIEFTVQILQLLNAGRLPFLQGSQTLPALRKLAQYELITQEEAAQLTEGYEYLRNVEHRLQMDDNRQTHTIPAEKPAQERLARLMGARDARAFFKLLNEHRAFARRIFDRFIHSSSEQHALLADFENADEWKALLASRSFADPDRAFRLAQEFVQGPGFGHLSTRTVQSGMLLLRRLLEFCPPTDTSVEYPEMPLSDPDRVLARLDSFITRYGARSTLFDAWVSNPSLFKLLIFVFDRSEFLAEVAINTPDLIDTLELTGHIRRKKTRDVMVEELSYGLDDKDQSFWLRRYFQAELMRIGLREIVGLSNLFQSQRELTALAEACLEYGLGVCLRKHGFKEPPFAIIALGKFGGEELVYGSDLDIVFVAPNNATNLPKLQKVANDLRELLSARTEMGSAFSVDTRLRPDGEKGLMVNTLSAFEDYYLRRAMLWEIQSLTRARPVGGHPEAGARFLELATKLANFSGSAPLAAAFTPEWKAEIDRMRGRIETERTPSGKQQLAIKTGTGGLIDAEFIAQTVALQEGWHEPNTSKALERGTGSSLLPEVEGHLLEQEYLRLVQIEGTLRRWSFESEATLPEDPAAQYRVAVRCGFRDAATFFGALDECRKNIRSVYERVFREGTRSATPKAPPARNASKRRK